MLIDDKVIKFIYNHDIWTDRDFDKIFNLSTWNVWGLFIPIPSRIPRIFYILLYVYIILIDVKEVILEKKL